MPKKNSIRTSEKQAEKASKVLKDPKAPKVAKSLAAGVLGNRRKKT